MVAFLASCATVPEPLQDGEIARRAAADKSALRQVTVPLDRPLSFGGVVAHALANNLEIRLANLDAVLQRGVVDLTDLQKLPSLLINAGYTHRSRPAGSFSDRSGDIERRTSSAELSWSILDFGVSYIRAKQEGNNFLVAEERKRRAANAIVNDVRLTFWQTVLGEQRLPQIREITRQIDGAMGQSRRLAESGLQDPLVSMTYQEGLLELQRQMKAYEGEIVQGRQQLARLLSLHPDHKLTLVADRRDEAMRELPKVDVAVMEDVALASRTELREQDYVKRNRRLDVYAAYFSMLPNLRLRAAYMRDSTSTLLFNDWYEYGFTGALSLLGIYQQYQRADQAKLSVASTDLRRLALSMAIMEQTRTAREQLTLLDDEFALATQTTAVRQKIWETRRDRLPFGENDELERNRAAVALVGAQITEDRAYARLQRAYGDLLASLGIDQFPEGFDLLSPEDAAAAIERYQAGIPQEIRTLVQRFAVAAEKPRAPPPAAEEKPVTDAEKKP